MPSRILLLQILPNIPMTAIMIVTPPAIIKRAAPPITCLSERNEKLLSVAMAQAPIIRAISPKAYMKGYACSIKIGETNRII